MHRKIRFTINLRILLTLAFAGLAALLCAVMALLVGEMFADQTREQIRCRLTDVVALSARDIDVELHNTLTRPEQEGNDVYRKIQRALQDAQNTATDIHFVYTMRGKPDGTIEFVVDAETNEADIAHLGDIYDDASDLLTTRFSSLEAPLVENETYTDRWGTWLSGYAPFFDRAGKRAGVLGMDINTKDIASVRNRALLTTLLVFLAILPFCVILGWLAAGIFSKHIHNLQGEAESLIRWGPHMHDSISSVSEVASLGTALSTMKSLLDGIRDIVFATDLDGNIVYINKAGCNMIGREREDILGQNIILLGEESDEPTGKQQMLLKTFKDGHWQGKIAIVSKDDKKVMLDSQTELLRDAHGKPVGMVCISNVRKE